MHLADVSPPEDATKLFDWLNRLAADMREIIKLNRVGERAHRTERGPLEEVAYLARTQFGCELFLFARPQKYARTTS